MSFCLLHYDQALLFALYLAPKIAVISPCFANPFIWRRIKPSFRGGTSSTRGKLERSDFDVSEAWVLSSPMETITVSDFCVELEKLEHSADE